MKCLNITINKDDPVKGLQKAAKQIAQLKGVSKKDQTAMFRISKGKGEGKGKEVYWTGGRIYEGEFK